ncbi:30S ribosomal protein S20 [Candidatus Aerophobetes bacterium]|nr:30S ribosomal protein S20 [Candidatus Aerophobetes bacterium]
MPQTKSAKKRMKQSEKKTTRNRQIESRVKNALKKFLQLTSQKNLEEAKKQLPQIITLIDSAASKGIWHKNKAARMKAKLMKKINVVNKV